MFLRIGEDLLSGNGKEVLPFGKRRENYGK
jgi:hypothetical protein